MPASIKHAIIQPRVLHPDAKSFYESTLWRKEKEICLSRMARDSKEQTEVCGYLFCIVILDVFHVIIISYVYDFIFLGFIIATTIKL